MMRHAYTLSMNPQYIRRNLKLSLSHPVPTKDMYLAKVISSCHDHSILLAQVVLWLKPLLREPGSNNDKWNRTFNMQHRKYLLPSGAYLFAVTRVEEVLGEAMKTRYDVHASSDQILFVRQGNRSHGRRDESERCDDNGELHGEQCL